MELDLLVRLDNSYFLFLLHIYIHTYIQTYMPSHTAHIQCVTLTGEMMEYPTKEPDTQS